MPVPADVPARVTRERKYSPTTDQAALTTIFDIEAAISAIPSTSCGETW